MVPDKFLSFASILVLAVIAAGSGASAQEQKLWDPVVDLSLKGGNNRSLGSLNFMAPLKQDRDRMIFGDARIVLSDQDTQEGNIGLGYRQITSAPGQDVILGGYVFYDHRKSEYDNSFHQITAGAEVIGKNWDSRVNVYKPIGEEQKLAYNGGSTAALQGTQVFVRDGRVYESSFSGFDLELGHTVPFTDNRVRAYGGYFKFNGQKGTKDIDGIRTRVAADINEWVRLGAEYQFADDVRGDSVFGEIRVRMPLDGWHSKKVKPERTALQSRMMEPIVRDIDIVTTSQQSTETFKALAADGSGESVDVFFVDNTAAGGGDGSQERPFNTLAAAQTAAGKFDTIYVLNGDGTTTGMNAGITIDDRGQRLLGSGVDLVLNSSNIAIPSGSSANIASLDKFVIRKATTVPVITNGAGVGVTVTAHDAEVAGLAVSGATSHGIHAINVNNSSVHDVISNSNGGSGVLIDANASTIDKANVYNVIANANAGRGVYVLSQSGGSITNAVVDNVQASNNTSTGVNIEAFGAASRINAISASNLTTHRNGASGINVGALDSGTTGNISVTSVTANNNTGAGVVVQANGTATSTVGNVAVSNVSATSNTTYGLHIQAQADDVMGTVDASSISATTNNNMGILIWSIFTNARMGNVALRDSLATSNTSRNINIEANGLNAVMGNVTVSNTTAKGGPIGFQLGSWNGGTMGDLVLRDLTAMNHTGLGVQAFSDGPGNTSRVTSVTANNITAINNQVGMRTYAAAGDIMGNVVISNLNSRNNTQHGFDAFAGGVGGTHGTLTLQNSTLVNNTLRGFTIDLQNNDASMGQVKLQNTTITGNGTVGVFVNDDSTQSINVELTNNRIFGNTGREVQIDLDGGVLNAQSNWWGVPTGLNIATEAQLDSGTVNASSPLIVDPGQ